MPVLVAPSSGPLGAALVVRLLAEGGEVRAYAPQEWTAEVRGAGAFVAHGDLDDPGRLESAMAQVHTVVVLAIDPLGPSAERMLVDVRTVIGAAERAEVRRLLALSVPGADRHGPDPLRRVAGAMEAELAAAQVPSVVVRSSLIDTPALRDALVAAGGRLDRAALDSTVAPVHVEDLAELLTAFDAMRSESHQGHVVFSADGARPRPLGTWLRQLQPPTGPRFVGRVYRPPEDIPLLEPALARPWITQDPTVFDAWEFTDLVPRPVVAASPGSAGPG